MGAPGQGAPEHTENGYSEILTPTEGVDFSDYMKRVVASVRRNWYAVMPESAQLGDRGRVALQFRIMRDGSVPTGEPTRLLGSGKSRWTARRCRRSGRRTRLSHCLRRSAGRISNCAFTSCTICLSKPRISETVATTNRGESDPRVCCVAGAVFSGPLHFFHEQFIFMNASEAVDLPLLVVAGPTASGKSALAVALAREFSGEIVACDSTQLYRGVNIGTAKPTVEERGGIAHHLIDVLDASEAATAGGYRDLALAVLADLRARGKLPILVVGTGLYMRALLEGLADLPLRSEELRERLPG